MPDKLFKTDDYIFSYRAGGLMIRNGKLSMQKMFLAPASEKWEHSFISDDKAPAPFIKNTIAMANISYVNSEAKELYAKEARYDGIFRL